MSGLVHYAATGTAGNRTPVSVATPLPVSSVAVGVDGATAATGANPVPVRTYGASNVATGVASGASTIGTSATLICNARPTRTFVRIINNGTTAVYIGPSNVATTTGAVLPGVVGAYLDMPVRSALYGIVASGTADIRQQDFYD